MYRKSFASIETKIHPSVNDFDFDFGDRSLDGKEDEQAAQRRCYRPRCIFGDRSRARPSSRRLPPRACGARGIGTRRTHLPRLCTWRHAHRAQHLRSQPARRRCRHRLRVLRRRLHDVAHSTTSLGCVRTCPRGNRRCQADLRRRIRRIC